MRFRQYDILNYNIQFICSSMTSGRRHCGWNYRQRPCLFYRLLSRTSRKMSHLCVIVSIRNDSVDSLRKGQQLRNIPMSWCHHGGRCDDEVTYIRVGHQASASSALNGLDSYHRLEWWSDVVGAPPFMPIKITFADISAAVEFDRIQLCAYPNWLENCVHNLHSQAVNCFKITKVW